MKTEGKALYNFLMSHPDGISGDLVRIAGTLSEKSQFKELAEKFLRATAKAMGLSDFEVHFNPGGPAVSGDAYLYSDRVFVAINADAHGVLYRKCVRKPSSAPAKKGKKVKAEYDSLRGGNHWFPFGVLDQPDQVLLHLEKIV